MIGDQTSFTAELAQLETKISTLSQYQDIKEPRSCWNIKNNSQANARRSSES